ncbi:glycosyl transferase family 1 [Opitutaceae bacterium TAV5]|nr:glycosyl transferase family 1 [Opitutaceae bacterium TAV5]
MKLVLLHSRLSGYLAACLRAFKRLVDAELLVYAWPNQPNAPFDASVFQDLGSVLNRHEHADAAILRAVRAFSPDAVLVSGWADKGYARICRRLKANDIPVIAGCDTQWTGSLRQYGASWVSPWHLHRFIDVLWVTGERQRYLANKLGYSGARCWEGYYACDWEVFADRAHRSSGIVTDERAQKPFFLYVGRYAPEKGLDTLADAYRQYRAEVPNPWPLICAGRGECRELLLQAGAEDRGFVQPGELPALMREASAFILPSRFEPWGVVLQEAAAAGLPLIASEACGAAVHLLRHLYNGYCFPTGDAGALTEALLAMHRLSKADREVFSQASLELSKQYRPERWAATLAEGLATIRKRKDDR